MKIRSQQTYRATGYLTSPSGHKHGLLLYKYDNVKSFSSCISSYLFLKKSPSDYVAVLETLPFFCYYKSDPGHLLLLNLSLSMPLEKLSFSLILLLHSSVGTVAPSPVHPTHACQLLPALAEDTSALDHNRCCLVGLRHCPKTWQIKSLPLTHIPKAL